jgi:hypothetical protein
VGATNYYDWKDVSDAHLDIRDIYATINHDPNLSTTETVETTKKLDSNRQRTSRVSKIYHVSRIYQEIKWIWSVDPTVYPLQDIIMVLLERVPNLLMC